MAVKTEDVGSLHSDSRGPLLQEGDSITAPHGLEEGNDQEDRRTISAIYENIELSSDHFKNFLVLVVLLVYSGVYMAVIYLQADSEVSFEVSTAHKALLPKGFNVNADNYLDSQDAVFQWLNSSIVQPVWKDAECGDGICDSSAETPAFGPNYRFGCLADCGPFPKTTTIVIQFFTTFPSLSVLEASSWNLCMTYPAQFCWFEQAANFTNSLIDYNETSFQNLPDGHWSFVTSAPPGTIEAYFYFNSSYKYSQESNTGGNNYLWNISDVCSTTPTTPYGFCREGCEIEALCVQSMCDNLGAKALTKTFLSCLSKCPQSQALEDPLHSQSCSNIYLGWLKKGNTDCQDLPLTAPEINNASISEPGIPREEYQGTLWEKLGPSDSERLFNLGVAVQRCLYTMIKDECLVKQPKTLSLIPAYTAFFCTFFGGPTNLTGCIYNSTRTNTQLTTDQQLLTEMLQIHRRLRVAKDQQDRFSELFLWALQSVYLLDTSTVAGFQSRLQQLDSAILTFYKGYGCSQADGLFSFKSFNAEVLPQRAVPLGGVIKWVWMDDDQHGLVLTDINNVGFGSSNLSLSRTNLCTMDNVGSSGIGLDPTPCNLVSPSSMGEGSEFSYSYYFKDGVPGQTESPFFDSVYWNVNFGFLINDTANSPTSSCDVTMIADGKCDVVCNSPDYFSDGGDCSCPVNEFGKNVCSCPLGQARDPEGNCCDPNLNSNLLNFTISNFTKTGEDFKETDADILISKQSKFSRKVSKLNKVVIGLLLSQERRASISCDTAQTRFKNLSNICLGGSSVGPFGANPEVLLGSSLYEESYVEAVKELYSQDPTFLNDSFAFKKANVPYGFLPVVLQEDDNVGFKFFIDVNLNNENATSHINFLKDGSFLDEFSSKLTAEVLTFNSEASLFTLVSVEVSLNTGGRLLAVADIKSLKLEHYNFKETMNVVRFALEILFLVGLSLDFVLEVRKLLKGSSSNQPFLAYFSSFSNLVDLASMAFMVAGVCFWVLNVVAREVPFTVSEDYTLYEYPHEAALSPFNTWKVANSTDFSTALNVFATLRDLSSFRAYYFSLQGINFVLLVIRVLKLLSFHPRMGIMTRTLSYAAPDLFHFFIVFAFVILSYSLFANIVFGRLVNQYRTLTDALNNCFLVFSGNNRPSEYLFRLRGWELIAGTTFWWSYVFLVFFVVMNMLIAIIVETFKRARKEAGDMTNSKWIVHDFGDIVKNFFKRILPGRFSRRQQLLFLQLNSSVSEFQEKSTAHSKKQHRIQLGEKVVDKEELCRLLHLFKKRDGNCDQLASDIMEEVATHTSHGLNNGKSSDADDFSKLKEYLMEGAEESMRKFLDERKASFTRR